jgi:hypothetical protein
MIWQPEVFLTASFAVLGVFDAMQSQQSLSIESVRTTASLIPPSLSVNVASMGWRSSFISRAQSKEGNEAVMLIEGHG